jgi:GTPase Era involved in 16S rRNA processing
MNQLRQQINIAIIGTVSAGKSTLTNALFDEQFSDMRIKRTTTLPQVYYEVESKNDMSNLKEIRESNRVKNKEIMDKTANGHQLKIEDIKEVEYYVPKLYNMLDSVRKEDVYYTIYDMPGLNDSMTKSVYYQYINDNFHKFDIILFVIDISSALNTSDEIDILKMTLNNMKANKEKYDIDSKLVIIINKCDEMEISEKIPQPNDVELLEMVVQVKSIVDTQKNEIYKNAITDIICLSAEDAYIYRMFNRNPKSELDEKYINKLGSNEFGKRTWNRKTMKHKKDAIVELFKSFDYKQAIELTGFKHLNDTLSKYLSDEDQYKYLCNHIKFSLSDIKIPKSYNISDELNKLYIIMVNYGCIHYIFNIEVPEHNVFKEKLESIIEEYKLNQSAYMSNNILSKDLYVIVKNIKNIFIRIENKFTKFCPTLNVEDQIDICNDNMNKYLCRRILDKTITKVQLFEILVSMHNNEYDNIHKIIKDVLSNLYNYDFINKSVSNIEKNILFVINKVTKEYGCTDIKLEVLYNNFRMVSKDCSHINYWFNIINKCERFLHHHGINTYVVNVIKTYATRKTQTILPLYDTIDFHNKSENQSVLLNNILGTIIIKK